MKNNTDFLIENNDCSNINELIDLSKTYYSEGDIINKSYLEWQYLKNPSGKPFLLTSREAVSKELAGQYLVLPLKFNLANSDVKGSLSLNTLTSPKYQGKGLFTKMAKATYDECEKANAQFTIGFPNPNSYPGFVRKLDFQHLGDIPLLIKPLKYFNLAFSFLKRGKQKHGGDISLNTSKINPSTVKSFDFNDKNLVAKYNKFWEAIKGQYKASVNKDFEYIFWRYHAIPTREYKMFYIEEDNVIKGVIVLRAEHVWSFNVGLVMDLLVFNNDTTIGKQLLKFSKKLFKHSKIDFIAALHNRTCEYSILKKSIFFTIPKKLLPQKIHFIVRLNKDFPKSEMLFKPENWKLTFGDYDIF